MEKNKVTFLREKSVKKRAEDKLESFCASNYAQNPIAAKFLIFQETKKEISPKDLLE